MSGRFARVVVTVAVVAALLAPAGASTAVAAETYVPISGSGSTWAQNALDQWRHNVAGGFGMTVNYSGTGSTAGRQDFINQTVDFAVSEIPFQADPEDGSPPEAPTTPYAYVPIVAGGTSLMYNLRIGGQWVTNLRLSGEVITGIFSGGITNWNDPAIQADNPSLAMPDRPITPVYRSDGSGTSAQFTRWMSQQFPSIWTYGMRSQFPAVNSTFKGQSGSLGVAGYVSQGYGEGAITYVENSYALKSGFPVAKVLNAAGYYVPPTANAASIALLGARVDEQGIQQLDDVYDNSDPRAYPISSYSYLIVPTQPNRVFTAAKGDTLSTFARYMICEGQQFAVGLGYAPLPINLVREAAARIATIPGAVEMSVDACDNPTFEPGDTDASNALLRDAPMPPLSDLRVGRVNESDLVDSNRTLTIDVVDNATAVVIRTDVSHADHTLHAGVFSEHVDLGMVALNAEGAASVDLSDADLAPGSTHRFYLAETDGTVVAWNSFTVPAEWFSQFTATNLEVAVTASDRFELSAPTSTTIDFGDVGRSTTSAAQQLGQFTVIDDRNVLEGWAVQISVDDFAAVSDPSRTIPGAAVGYTPAQMGAIGGVELGFPQEAGEAVYPATLATGTPGTSTGEAGATFGVGLAFRAPSSALPADYRSTLTLTLISR